MIFLSLLLDYLYSLWFCLRVFPFGVAIRVPVNISRHVRLGEVWRGCIDLQTPVRHNMLYVGHQGYSAVAEQEGLLHIGKGGRLIVEGTARLGQGIRLWIDSGSAIRLGDDFYCNKNCFLRACDADIRFGKEVLLGWDIEVNTTDGHQLMVAGVAHPNHADICVGHHVWIASHVIVGKGAVLPDDTVVAARSLVNAKFIETKTLIGGTPAKVLKQDVTWKQ